MYIYIYIYIISILYYITLIHTYIFSDSINTRRRTEYPSNRYVKLSFILQLNKYCVFYTLKIIVYIYIYISIIHTYIFSESINARRRMEYSSSRYVKLSFI